MKQILGDGVQCQCHEQYKFQFKLLLVLAAGVGKNMRWNFKLRCLSFFSFEGAQFCLWE